MQEHPAIELYLNLSDEAQAAQAEQVVSAIDLDEVVNSTLQAAAITQSVMLTLLITDDAGIQEMNRQYREQDKATDVLSFPLLEQPIVQAPAEQLWTPQDSGDGEERASTPAFVTPPGMATNLGDIVISWPTVQRQAREAGHEETTEFVYLLSHGVLHLIGYDDHTESGYQAMVAIQQAVLQKLGQKAYRS
ncbi:endoribonuclease YbeY [Dictyobacter sp. S3.2.2.5]|uniref:Endoribonuclease YbeY n=1 Tax=Dictyobacter halimunensis TaxID=3026934 RepID=A0ABQ6FUP4_9CHLR|nr:endoribonuclease YbeY [Dictyobacter sp. S3.2.2.5]